ncbi:hypothetical protein DVA86_21140 [Streptomyces armeniacus]|uniref:Serine/threonine protein kinase n=1 Tax=Streptomyces armeniacus TaxID=83291 RepID=A0A345Y0V3_9ACTN|nr:hypothetical protein [Streptomyces armeniacus]AXK37519.1 hypothetical protein DVA86_21140 [Streptomyces armeniacus]
MSQPQQQRASRLRTAALASTVALAAALPLAVATADTSGPGSAGSRMTSVPPSATRLSAPSAASPSGPRASPGPPASPARPSVRDEAGSSGGARDTDRGRPVGATAPAAPAAPAVPDSSGHGRLTASCGPELTSPGGLQAQTCVLEENGRTWARTYHHNTSGERVRAVLSLLGPDGRTVRVSCVVEAAARPGLCETPRDAAAVTARAADGVDRSPEQVYSAVAEFASLSGDRLLLRAGSNSPRLAAS